MVFHIFVTRIFGAQLIEIACVLNVKSNVHSYFFLSVIDLINKKYAFLV